MAGSQSSHRKLKSRIEIPFDEITERLKDGRFQLHKIGYGIIITEIKDWAGERILCVFWLGGKEFDFWKDRAFVQLVKFGREHGCKAIEARCRPGLAAKLRPLGFRTIKTEVRVEI